MDFYIFEDGIYGVYFSKEIKEKAIGKLPLNNNFLNYLIENDNGLKGEKSFFIRTFKDLNPIEINIIWDEHIKNNDFLEDYTIDINTIKGNFKIKIKDNKIKSFKGRIDDKVNDNILKIINDFKDIKSFEKELVNLSKDNYDCIFNILQ